MKFGCVIKPEEYGLIASLGYDYVELNGRSVCTMEAQANKGLRQMIHSGPIPCLGFNAYCPPEIKIAGPGFSPVRAREYAKRCAELAAELGVRVIGIGSPKSRNLPEGFHRELALRQAAEFFQITADVFAPYNIYVCVEALGSCYCNFINHLWEAQSLVKQLELPNLKLVADFYNMEHSGEADSPLDIFAKDIVHVHISDDAGRPDMRWFLKEEKRDIHIARLRRLYSLAYDSTLSVEIDLQVDPQAAVSSLRILRDSATCSDPLVNP